MRGVVGEGKCNSLTLISYIRSKEISLQAVSQTAKPPALIVFVQDLDDVATANSELIRPVSVVVIEGNNLKLRRNEGGVRGVGHGMWVIGVCSSIKRGPQPEQGLTSGWAEAESVSRRTPEEMQSEERLWEEKTDTFTAQ